MNWSAFNIGMGLLNLYVGYAEGSTVSLVIGVAALSYGLLTWPKGGNH